MIHIDESDGEKNEEEKTGLLALNYLSSSNETPTCNKRQALNNHNLSALNDITLSSSNYGTGSEFSSTSASSSNNLSTIANVNRTRNNNRRTNFSNNNNNNRENSRKKKTKIQRRILKEPKWADFLNYCTYASESGRNKGRSLIFKIIMVFIAAVCLNIIWVYCPITLVYKSDLVMHQQQQNLRQGGYYYYEPTITANNNNNNNNALLHTDNLFRRQFSQENNNMLNMQQQTQYDNNNDNIPSTIQDNEVLFETTKEAMMQKSQGVMKTTTSSFEEGHKVSNQQKSIPDHPKEYGLNDNQLQEQKEESPISEVAEKEKEEQKEDPVIPDQAQEVKENQIDDSELNSFANAWEPYNNNIHQPVFWSIGSSTIASSSLLDIMTTCHRLIQTLDAHDDNDGTSENNKHEELAYVRPDDIPAYQDPRSYVNCDTTTIKGVKQCKALGLSSKTSNKNIKADFLYSPFIYELDSLLFNDNNGTTTKKGKLFATFQHPIRRTIDNYNYFIQQNLDETNYDPELAKMTLEEYTNSIYDNENNILTRTLTNTLQHEKEVTREDLNTAMSVVNRKLIVGLISNETETIDRFEKYFSWNYIVNPDVQEMCRNTILQSSASTDDKIPEQGDDPIYDKIYEKNNFDIELYSFIESLFIQQEQFVSNVNENFRNDKSIATCSKCVPPTFPTAVVDNNVAVDSVLPVIGTDMSFKAPIPDHPEFSGFKDVTDPFENTDQPTFWHIPKAGGSTVKDIMGTCYRFTQASEAGIVEGHDKDIEIAVVRPGGESPFINCDASTVHGLKRCKELGLAESNLADFIASPYVYELEEIFSPKARGRLFTVFRHPVDRAVSLFYYIQIADWEPTYSPELAKLTLSEFAVSQYIENNWMVRTLTSCYAGEISEEHLTIAKDIIKRKFLVGLLSEKIETMERIEKFFKWKYRVHPENQEKCREKLLIGGSNSNAKNKQIKPKKGDEAYELIAAQNEYDIKLYEFIEEQFKAQADLFQDIPDGSRNVNASCAKCVPPTFPTIAE